MHVNHVDLCDADASLQLTRMCESSAVRERRAKKCRGFFHLQSILVCGSFVQKLPPIDLDAKKLKGLFDESRRVAATRGNYDIDRFTWQSLFASNVSPRSPVVKGAPV